MKTPSPKGEKETSRISSRSLVSSRPSDTNSQTKSPNQSNQKPKNYVNVLLLGELGVGKSTFINAIVNYLEFDTLEHARFSQLIAVMPVSFLLTVGDHFAERFVRFGGQDSNEDYSHPDQSVTQHCRSYVFTIGTQTRLRLIDTPGMGDTRGLEQDDLNMQHIISFIDNLSHLNAICILLKPNESKLNIILRLYLNKLLNFLGENVHSNIVFCFTNTRSTFFAPGDTEPLLRSMLKSCSLKGIPLEKSNTFCFDNESFRHLIPIQDGVEFDDYQNNEYRQSWVSSVSESNRWIKYICQKLEAYSSNDWKSIEHARFQIDQMTRPMIETTRNIFRNLILSSKDRLTSLIRLCPVPINHSSTICIECKNDPKNYGGLWIFLDNVHNFTDRCSKCHCSQQSHININYRLDYQLSDDSHPKLIGELKSQSDRLREAILEFGYLFKSSNRTLKLEGPILSLLNRTVDEETQIYKEKQKEACLNLILRDELNQLREEYKRRQRVLPLNENLSDLTKLYEHIQSICIMDPIKQQLGLLKQYNQNVMNEQEKQIF